MSKLCLTEQRAQGQPGPSIGLNSAGFLCAAQESSWNKGVLWVLWRSSSTMPVSALLVSSPEEAWRKAVIREGPHHSAVTPAGVFLLKILDRGDDPDVWQ